MFRFVSVVMIVATVIFAVSSAFIFRSRANSVRTRVACSLIHVVTFEIIAVVMLEIFRVGYMTNIYVSDQINADMFGYIHMIISSVCVVVALICVVVSLRSGLKCRAITAGGMAVCGIALGVGGYFALGAFESVSEELTVEYTSAALPVIIGAALVVVFAVANILLDTECKWMRAVMTVVNIIEVAICATVFVTLLGWGRDISGGGSEAVYAVAIFGIIVILPPIICMCSVFADRLNPAKAKK